MKWLALGIAATLPVLLGVAFRLGRSLPRPTSKRSLLSPVTQQHLHLFQGGRLSDSAVETAKARLRSLLERGAIDEAEASLRPGLGYAVQVQALAELAIPQAGAILQRQLGRRLSDDPVEQSWYWIDLAHGLRSQNCRENLPHLLRCPASATDVPLGQFFAAETTCCLGFDYYVVRPNSPLGQAALRLLHQTLRGLRFGVQPQVVGEGRMGETISQLWRHRSNNADPLIVSVFVETLRLIQRVDHAESALAGNAIAAGAHRKQMSKLLALEDAIIDYLGEVKDELLNALSVAADERRAEILLALEDLRVEASKVVLQGLGGWPAANRTMGVRLLRYGRTSETAPSLLAWTKQFVHPVRRAKRPSRIDPPTRPSVPDEFPYAEILRALRGHPTPEVEAFLVIATHDWDPTYRAVAAGALGWWDPFDGTVAECLNALRNDGNGEVRFAAQAALARLGERRALQFFRQKLIGETDTDAGVADVIRRVASEGLVWLWPELDRLADSDEAEVSQTAREALEQMREDLSGGPLRR